MRMASVKQFFLTPLHVCLLLISALVVIAVVLLVKPDSSSATSSQPNVVLIVSDDQRPETLSIMPQVNSLIASGTNFRNAYATTALCCPARSTILTGEYAHNHNIKTNKVHYSTFQDTSTLATWLRDGGYKTGMVGKYLNNYTNMVKNGTYHVPPGWDTFQVFKEANYYNYMMTDYVDGVKNPLRTYGSTAADYSTDVVATKTVDFLNRTETSDEQPFFAYVAPFSTHSPYTPAPRHVGGQLNIGTYNPPSYNEADVSDKPTWVQNQPLMGSIANRNITNQRAQTYRMAKSLDELVGQVKNKLAELGELENTVIIYIGDNAFHWGEHRIYQGKDTPYEEAAKVPLVVYDGRDPQARTVTNLVANVDIAPTILELTGLTIPTSVDGRSLLGFLEGQAMSWRTEQLQEGWGGVAANDTGVFAVLREETWKFIEYETTGERELYDLSVDPYELENVASRPENAARILLMKSKLDQLQTCQGASCN